MDDQLGLPDFGKNVLYPFPMHFCYCECNNTISKQRLALLSSHASEEKRLKHSVELKKIYLTEIITKMFETFYWRKFSISTMLFYHFD